MSVLKQQLLTTGCVVAWLVCLPLFACNSNLTQSNAADPTSESPQKTVRTTKISTGPEIDLNCVINHIQNPPESFHYAFKVESDNPWEEEADVTPETIAGSFKNNSLPDRQKFHGAPREVSSNLLAIGRMASLFATVRGTSAVVNEGPEKNVNSYSTFKYSIDTARGSAAEQSLFRNVLGPGGFEKGAAWVTSDGCPVRILLDEELHSKDGSTLGKAHYEERMVRK